MHCIHPTEEQLFTFQSLPKTGPIVMVNLLKFKPQVNQTEASGEAVYTRYMQRVAPLLEEVGGRLLWMGDVSLTLIGSDADQWDRVMLVEYPSAQHFLQMISSPKYQEVQQDRTRALVHSALLVSSEKFGLFNPTSKEE